MSTKKVQRVRSENQDNSDLRRWRGPDLRAPVHAWAIAFALGVGLALCEADIFVPLFWQRRAAVQVGLVLVAALLQTPLLIPPVRGFLQAIQWHRSPVRALAHWAIALGLGASLLALGSTAGSRFLSAFQTSPEEVIATTAGLLNREVLWAYLGLMGVLFVLHGTRSRLARLTQQERTLLPLFFLAAAFAAVYLLNTLLPMLDVRAGKFAMPEVVPTYEPVGMDFRRGMHLPAERLLSGERVYPEDAAKSPNLYPPFVTLLGTLLVFLSEERAVLLHVLALFAANVLCVTMAALLWLRTRSAVEEHETTTDGLEGLTLVTLVGVMLFSGYPFLFSIERGNVDALAMLLAIAAYLLLATHPERMWWQIVLLSLAIHIKAYPALLLVPLFLVHRQRMLLPTLLVNVALLLCMGPANAAGFLRSIRDFYEPIVWVGNHSAYSFAGILSAAVGVANPGAWLLYAALVSTPLILWAAGLRATAGYHNTVRLAAAGLVLTTPAMAVLPAISYDYQLVILYAPLLLLFAMIAQSMRERQEPEDYVQLLLLALAAGMIGRSYLIMPSVGPLIQNKYAWVILIELVALAQVLREMGEAGTERGVRHGGRASVRK